MGLLGLGFSLALLSLQTALSSLAQAALSRPHSPGCRLAGASLSLSSSGPHSPVASLRLHSPGRTLQAAGWLVLRSVAFMAAKAWLGWLISFYGLIWRGWLDLAGFGLAVLCLDLT